MAAINSFATCVLTRYETVSYQDNAYDMSYDCLSHVKHGYQNHRAGVVLGH